MMRLKTVQENIDNFHAVTEDAITRITKLKEGCGQDGHIPDLEQELKKFSMESELLQGLTCLKIEVINKKTNSKFQYLFDQQFNLQIYDAANAASTIPQG